jgi:hypothetical protein
VAGAHVRGTRFGDAAGVTVERVRVPRPVRPADPLAVALGNASMLGVGYALLGRRVLAVLACLVSVALVAVLAAAAPFVWFEVIVVGWWAVLVGHGWVLARARPRPAGARTQRWVALAAAVPVLLAVGLLRFDAGRVEDAVADARNSGDCRAALAATDGLWFGHRLADAPLTARTDDTVAACDRLRAAATELRAGLSGDTGALDAGFGHLAAVLPTHERMVTSTVDVFLGGLPTRDPCDTTVITDWLGREKPGGPVLGRATDLVPRIAPAALVACADRHLAAGDWPAARDHYRQLLDEYPGHDLAPEATTGAREATQAIELANVRGLLAPQAGGALPAYCATPAPYSGAAPFVSNAPNRALVFGNEAHTGKIPPGWLAREAADAVVVICAGETEYGTPVQTCPYEATLGLFGYQDVTFRKIAIPVRVFEVRTARLVAEFKVEIGGASCPPVLEYTSYSYTDFGPPSEVYVTASITDVQAAFRPLLTP